MGALDRGPFNLTGLAVDGCAFLGGIVLSEGFRPHLVQPHEAELAVGLLTLEADREVRGLVRGSPDQNAIVVDVVAEDHLLDGKRNVRHLRGEGQFRIRVQDIELDVVRILDIRIGIVRSDGRLNSASHPLQVSIGQGFLGVDRQRGDHHILQADRRRNSRGSGRIARHNLLPP